MPEVDLEFLETRPKCSPEQLATVRPSIAVLNAARGVKNTPSKMKKQMNAARVIRRFLNSKRPSDVDEKGQSRFVQMTANMVRLACGKSPQAVAAYNALMDRAFGKAKPHDDELDAMEKGGIQIVYVTPVELEGVPHAKPALAAKPEFLEGEYSEEEL